MKQLNEIAWNVTEEEYRESQLFSYSLLAKYERGGFNILKSLQEREESPALSFGSLVDCMLTDPERFNKDYYVVDLPVLSDTLKTIANELKIYGPFCTDENILMVADKYEYYKNWKPETRVKSIREKCGYYLEIFKLATDREIVDSQTYNRASSCVQAIKTNPATNIYFMSFNELNPFDIRMKYTNYYQLKFKATLDDGITYKCMLDCLHIDWFDKTIQPIDLKTTGKSEWEFVESFVKWSYQLQARLYCRILKACLKGTEYEDFKILPFKFVVVNDRTLTPLIWEYPDCDKVGNIEYNKDIIFRDPFEIANELSHYLKDSPKVPDGILEQGTNNLVTYLNLRR